MILQASDLMPAGQIKPINMMSVELVSDFITLGAIFCLRNELLQVPKTVPGAHERNWLKTKGLFRQTLSSVVPMRYGISSERDV